MYFAAPDSINTNTINLHDAENGFLVIGSLVGHASKVTSLAFADQAHRLASAEKGFIKIWNLDSMTESATFKCISQATYMAFSQDGTKLLESGLESENLTHLVISIWDIPREAIGTTIHVTQELWDIESYFVSSDSVIMSAILDNLVFWDCISGDEMQRIDFGTGGIYGISLNPVEGSTAAIASEAGITIIDIDHRHAVQSLRGHDKTVYCVCFSGDGLRLASGSADEKTIVWDVSTGTQLTTIVRMAFLTNVSLNMDGTIVACCTSARGIKVFSVQDQKTVFESSSADHGRFSRASVILL
jgi:WD40 repeat protein